MTTPKDKFKPVKCTTNLSPPTDWPPSELAAKRPVVYQRRPVTDWLAVFGVGSAVIAFLLWAWPETCYDFGAWYCSDWFLLSRISIFAPLFVLSFILLLLRRRN
jgi:hypothetical protein